MRSMLSRLRCIAAPHFFLAAALVYGIIFLILTPPFQVPDEPNHFYRAFQVADGNLLPTSENGRLGGHIPESFVKTVKAFPYIRGNMHAKANVAALAAALKIPFSDTARTFVDFPNTALYTPVSYLPQSVFIFILKKLNFSPLMVFYVTRFMTFLVWVTCMACIIRTVPVYKWLITFLSLLPMSLFIHMSLSADVVTNLLAFGFMTAVFKAAFSESMFRKRTLAWITLLAMALASSKLVYTPLVLLFLLIPVSKFQSLRFFFLYFSVVMISSGATAVAWLVFMDHLYIPYSEYNVKFRDGIDLVSCSNMHAQMDHILNGGTYIFRVFANSLVKTFSMYYEGYIGTLGWLDTKLPAWLVHTSYAFICLISVLEGKTNFFFSTRQKVILLLASLSATILVLLSQHLTWDCVGGDLIATIQGRYFIPVFPLFFMLMGTPRSRLFRFTIPVMLFTLFCLTCAVRTTYNRYYKPACFNHVNIHCDGEATSSAYYLSSPPGIYLENASTQSSEKSRSGNYAAKLTQENPFGFLYRYYQGKVGDRFFVEVWRYGHGGGIVISGNSGRDFYLTSSKSVEKDSAGWEKIQCQYMLEKDMTDQEIGIYIWNNTPGAAFFDDFFISISTVKE